MDIGGNFISPDECAFLGDGCLCLGKFKVANVLLSGAKWPSVHLVETVIQAFITDSKKEVATCRKDPLVKKLLHNQMEKHFFLFLWCSRFLFSALLAASEVSFELEVCAVGCHGPFICLG